MRSVPILRRQARAVLVGSLVLFLAAGVGAREASATAEVNFESGHVRPIAFLASADLLFAVSTPRDTLVVFDAGTGTLTKLVEVPVGFEPVAVAARVRSDGRIEAWVVNHVSDSVSIVEVDPANPGAAHVIRTLLVGDEPRDVVFGGPNGDRAFITAAHRGRNRPGDPQPDTQGVGRADVWAFDADALGSSFRGSPLTILTLFGDTPRGLAVTPDGATVYAAVFHSGSRTATVNHEAVRTGPGLPPLPPGTPPDAPITGLIVKYDPTTDRWEDELGRDWASRVPFDVPDLDVFAIDASAPVPVQSGSFSGVGTTLFNLAVRPDTGAVYVSNTEARNHVRFEPNIQGHVTESRITVIDGTTVTAVHLNPHIAYDVVPGPPAEVAESLAFPMDMAFAPDGATLYLTAFGSGSVAVLASDDLEAGVVMPRSQVAVGGGPSGVVVDPARDRLYVMLAFDHAIATVEHASLATRSLGGLTSLGDDPRPLAVRLGQRFLFDARGSSAHGDAACASCHPFGDADQLAWDLGDPYGSVLTIANPTITVFGTLGVGTTYHPAKGPFLTQSLRGMVGTGPMHWRGDRSAASSGGSVEDDAGNFLTFNVAFTSLLGRASPLPAADMQAFADYALTLVYPPNPYRPLDDVPTESMARGEILFRTGITSGAGPCTTCHALPRTTTGRVGLNEPAGQAMKIPHLRNAYQKVGLFGAAADNDHRVPAYFGGDVVRGFGLEFDGSLGSVRDFHNAFALDLGHRTELSDFILAIDSGLKPAVGQQVSLTADTIDDPELPQYLATLGRAGRAGHCRFVVLGGPPASPVAWWHAWGATFSTGRQADELIAGEALRAIVSLPGGERTGTCMLPQMAAPYALDGDRDTVSDRDEIAAGSDPGDPASLPAGFDIVRIGTKSLVVQDRSRKGRPSARKLAFAAVTKDAPAGARVIAPARGSAGDPRLGGATMILYNANGSGEAIRIPLPPSGWSAKGSDSRPNGYLYRAAGKSDPVKTVTVEDDKLVVRGGHELFEYTLDEPAQGRMAIRLTLGTAVQWCAAATGRQDAVDKFVANPNTPPPAVCPAM